MRFFSLTCQYLQERREGAREEVLIAQLEMLLLVSHFFSHSGPSVCALYLSHALPTGDIPYHSFPPTSWLDQLILTLKVLVSAMPFLGSFLWLLKLGCLFTPERFLSTWYLPCSGVFCIIIAYLLAFCPVVNWGPWGLALLYMYAYYRFLIIIAWMCDWKSRWGNGRLRESWTNSWARYQPQGHLTRSLIWPANHRSDVET